MDFAHTTRGENWDILLEFIIVKYTTHFQYGFVHTDAETVDESVVRAVSELLCFEHYTTAATTGELLRFLSLFLSFFHTWCSCSPSRFDGLLLVCYIYYSDVIYILCFSRKFVPTRRGFHLFFFFFFFCGAFW